jgi:hypothetical protein
MTHPVQCAIPVFDGLLPEPHNRTILDLLFVVAYWHGLAKLRMHTDVTLEILEAVTADLGAKLRSFRDKTCPAFDTKELTRELNARMRRQKRKTSTNHKPQMQDTSRSTVDGHQNADVLLPQEPAGSSSQPSNFMRSTIPIAQVAEPDAQSIISSSHPKASTRRSKSFNLNTYKHHTLGDYASTIRKYGTTDSYSAESVSSLRLFYAGSTHRLTCRLNWSTATRSRGTNARAEKVL